MTTIFVSQQSDADGDADRRWRSRLYPRIYSTQAAISCTSCCKPPIPHPAYEDDRIGENRDHSVSSSAATISATYQTVPRPSLRPPMNNRVCGLTPTGEPSPEDEDEELAEYSKATRRSVYSCRMPGSGSGRLSLVRLRGDGAGPGACKCRCRCRCRSVARLRTTIVAWKMLKRVRGAESGWWVDWRRCGHRVVQVWSRVFWSAICASWQDRISRSDSINVLNHDRCMHELYIYRSRKTWEIDLHNDFPVSPYTRREPVRFGRFASETGAKLRRHFLGKTGRLGVIYLIESIDKIRQWADQSNDPVFQNPALEKEISPSVMRRFPWRCSFRLFLSRNKLPAPGHWSAPSPVRRLQASLD
jgi:hypothetical protein